jgi:hypothetical protein
MRTPPNRAICVLPTLRTLRACLSEYSAISLTGPATPARHNGLMAQVVMFHSGDPGDRRGGQLTAVSQVSRWVPSWP